MEEKDINKKYELWNEKLKTAQSRRLKNKGFPIFIG